jgi:hypothetical protein
MSRLINTISGEKLIEALEEDDTLLVFEGYEEDKFHYSFGIERPDISGVFKFFITLEDAKGRYLGPFMPLTFLKGDLKLAIEEDRFSEIEDPYGIPG